MNINFYYKGQTVSIKADAKHNLRKVVENCLSKFEQHFYQELLLFGSNLRLRSRRTQSILNLSIIVGLSLQDNDTITIEPNENLTSSSSNVHAPKRYDLSNIDSNYSPITLKQPDYSYMKNNYRTKPKDTTKFLMDLKSKDKGHRYQKYDQSLGSVKNNRLANNPFDRNDTRRSLGADIAPQYDIQDFSRLRNDNYTTNIDSDSSISDFSNTTKPSAKILSQSRNLQTKTHEFEKNRIMESRSKSAPASPTKPLPPPRSPHTHMSMLNAFNVRTIGNKINISIVKKPNFGLGFTIVARDNQVMYGSGADVANSAVILVNKILSNGGAAEDNRLRPGDRLLEINGTSVISLKDTTDKLRAIPENDSVNLLISRVDRYETSNEQQLTNVSSTLSTKQITYTIPMNQNQNNRQLGLNILSVGDISLPPIGPGIYIHSILDNSLASQQGGLRVDDKIIGINGRSINDINVEETIRLLKKVMQNDSLLAITVCRVITQEQQPYNNDLQRKEQNYYLLPNKMSLLDKKITQNIDRRSHYSSNDSLPYTDAAVYQPDPATAFVRESKGRRSMSDKRKAHEDASQYSFYQETRSGNTHTSDERLYSTLPTASRLKKMTNKQSPSLPNKTQAPVKPSQIKQLNNPKSHQDQVVKPPVTPNRSVSLRNSPTRISQSNFSQNTKNLILSPSYEQQQTFNRAMNNSFKRAVQKSLPENGELNENVYSIENSYSTRKPSGVLQYQSSTEDPYPVSFSNQTTEKTLRSNSMKINDDKKKNFNLKNFLAFTPNVNRTKSVVSKDKSDTFPLGQRIRNHPQSINNNVTNIRYSPVDLPKEVQHSDDPLIIDSTKRVLEWQMKNDDVISKENLIKEQKYYSTVNPYCAVNSKSKAEVITNSRTQVPNRNVFPMKVHAGHEQDPYDTIDGTITSQTSVNKHKTNHARSSRTNSQPNIGLTSPRNGINSNSNTNTYQISNPTKNSQNDIYATVNKDLKKDPRPTKQPPSVSQTHINKYRF